MITQGVTVKLPIEDVPTIMFMCWQKIKKIPEELKGIPTSSWAWSSTGMGLLESAAPVILKTEGGNFPP